MCVQVHQLTSFIHSFISGRVANSAQTLYLYSNILLCPWPFSWTMDSRLCVPRVLLATMARRPCGFVDSALSQVQTSRGTSRQTHGFVHFRIWCQNRFDPSTKTTTETERQWIYNFAEQSDHGGGGGRLHEDILSKHIVIALEKSDIGWSFLRRCLVDSLECPEMSSGQKRCANSSLLRL